ncbi:hypothetical protein [Amycolatopsis sp. cmx-4-68]|uniref:hypothetical protein n=1 Tax=Amycolatopsis sp. cmx-4-68 TaxID=2790938 RepID=UPI0039794652
MITQEVAPVRPHQRYVVKAHVQAFASSQRVFFGVRAGDGRTVLAETGLGQASPYTELTVTFDSGDNSGLTFFSGYRAPRAGSWLRVDGFSLAPAPA